MWCRQHISHAGVEIGWYLLAARRHGRPGWRGNLVPAERFRPLLLFRLIEHPPQGSVLGPAAAKFYDWLMINSGSLGPQAG